MGLTFGHVVALVVAEHDQGQRYRNGTSRLSQLDMDMWAQAHIDVNRRGTHTCWVCHILLVSDSLNSLLQRTIVVGRVVVLLVVHGGMRTVAFTARECPRSSSGARRVGGGGMRTQKGARGIDGEGALDKRNEAPYYGSAFLSLEIRK